MTILECLSTGPKTQNELIDLTEIPRTTLIRQLKVIMENGNINQQSDKYKITKPTPSAHDISDQMQIIFQQKNMDRNFRKLKFTDKAAQILEWYFDYGLQGRIDDYFEGEKDDHLRDTLLNAIHEGYNLFLSKNKLNVQYNETK